MTVRIKQSPHPPTLCRQSTTSANATPHAATIVPQLVPLLDLLADLIARELLRERSGADIGLEHKVSETHVMDMAKGASTVVEKHGKLRSVSQFPSKVPPRVPPKSH
jgi:hypothetical protein